MKAARLHQRGGPEQIVVEDAPDPVANAGEVRIRVKATAITPGELTWNETYTRRDGTSRLPSIPGHDVAGTVDSVGAGVGDLAVGDAVYALIDFPVDGSAAQYAVAPASDVAHAPQSIPPEVAAAVPLSALTAWQGLFDHGKLDAGQTVLIHGGAGGVGAYAVQIARWRNARVVTTASPKNERLARELGADQVIDYTTTHFEKVVHGVDLVFDTVGGDTLARSIAVVRRGGRLVSIAAKPDESQCKSRGISGMFFIVRPSRDQLDQIARLIDLGRLKVNVQERYPLADARKAFERSIAGHLNGKIIITID